MAEWSKPLPGPAVIGAEGHDQDHNQLNAAVAEIRSVVDGLDDGLDSRVAAAIAPLAERIATLEAANGQPDE
jgi:hypothetical protein